MSKILPRHVLDWKLLSPLFCSVSLTPSPPPYFMNECWPFTIKYHREWKISRQLFLIFPFGLKWLNLLGFSLNFRHFLNNRFNKRNICWCFFLRGTNCQLISLRPLLRQRRLFIWCCIILHSKCFGYGCTESVEACMGNLQKQISHSADPTKCFIVWTKYSGISFSLACT